MIQVLVVDDDSITRHLLSRAVQSLGYGAIQASNGETAIQILIDNPDIGLVITDMMMPRLGGGELIKIIRSNDSLKNIPVIIVSGIVPLREISGILELGASRFMPKPINTNDLKEYVVKLIEKTGAYVQQ